MAEWDKTSAITAIVTLAIMLPLSSYGPALIAHARRLFLRAFWPALVQCETLCWDDISDGPLRHPRSAGYVGVHDGVHQTASECFASGLGKIFEHACAGAKDRKTVPKPKALDTKTTYLRTDAKTMRAFLLSHRCLSEPTGEMCFVFELIGRTLTAQYVTDGRIMFPAAPFTKHELELLQEGYPPLFRASITLPSGMNVPSPLRDHSHIELPGWIVHCGLNYMTPYSELYFHTMARYPDSVGEFWQQTRIRHAVDRFGVVLSKIQAALPRERLVVAAIELYNQMRLPTYHGTKLTSRSGSMEPPQGFRTIGFSSGELDEVVDLVDGSYTTEQWQIIFSIFDRMGPYTAGELAFLETHVRNIINVAFVGLLRVVEYGTGLESAYPLPTLPETRGHKYIYLRSCAEH